MEYSNIINRKCIVVTIKQIPSNCSLYNIQYEQCPAPLDISQIDRSCSCICPTVSKRFNAFASVTKMFYPHFQCFYCLFFKIPVFLLFFSSRRNWSITYIFKKYPIIMDSDSVNKLYSIAVKVLP